MCDLLGPGLKPVYPALAGRFLTTAPPGKPKAAPFHLSGKYPHGIDSRVILHRKGENGLVKCRMCLEGIFLSEAFGFSNYREKHCKIKFLEEGVSIQY